jgi:hypothetical protein
MTTHGKWSQPGVPHKGWTCIDVYDVGEPSHLCEMCEEQLVRYVHVMEHPDHSEALDVGCVCAGNMEQDPVGARKRETRLKSRQRQRGQWLDKPWRVSEKGNE